MNFYRYILRPSIWSCKKLATRSHTRRVLLKEILSTRSCFNATMRQQDRSNSESHSESGSTENPSDIERAELYKKRWKTWKITGVSLALASLVSSASFIYLYGRRKRDDVGNEIVDEFTHLAFPMEILSRAWSELVLFVTSVSEPSRDKLLPDPLKEPYYQPKYTVVFEISGILVHPDWTFNTGWRFKKRPAVDYFLKALGYPRTELVVYTNEQGMTAQAIIESLDPENVIMYKLYRDTTKYQYKDGAHVKDLSKLNRDLSKVIYIDWDSKAFQLNPENVLRLPKWTGDDDDLGLVDLANLIKTIIDSGVQDVRPVLQHYSSCSDPLKEFRENQALLLEKERSLQQEHRDESLTKSYAGKLFGFRRHT